jgi:RNA polymerase-binding protein DksA
MAQPLRRPDDHSAGEIDNQEFQTLLEQRRGEIFARSNATRSNIGEQLEQSAGPGDEADLSVMDTSADYFLRLADNERREMLEIEAALERIHRGTYGLCENCGNPIAAERLRKLPTARLDIDCQSSLEAQRRAMRPNPFPKL